MILNEMSYDRKKAIDKCSDLGWQFVDHFNKIWVDTDNNTKRHYASEMQGWYNEVSRIVLAHNKRKINEKQLYDWFFTVGSIPEVLFEGDEEEAEYYVEFSELVLDEGYSILAALIELQLVE